MAYNFTAANSRYLSSSAPVTAVPLTMACWFNAPSGSVARALMSVGIAANATARCNMFLDSSNRVTINAVGSGGGASSVTSAYTANVWNHACSVCESLTSRTAYLNAVAASANTTSITQSAFNALTVGARWLNTIGLYMDGLMAEVGIWNVALTQPEIASLAKGVTCDKIRPQNLVFYAPLIRNLQDTKGGLIITPNNNPTIATHPRIYK